MPHSIHGFNDLLVHGWELNEDRIAKCFKFGSFPEAMGFMVELSYVAEAQNHHPDWKNVYNKLFVELTTHDAGGVTAKDVALAQAFDAAYLRRKRVEIRPS